MGAGRPLGDLLAAAEHADDTELTLRIVGADYDELRREIARRGLDNCVHLAEPVAATALVDALAGFHVGLIINRPVTLTDELVVPNKLFEYLMAGLAVAVPRLPGMTPIVEGERVGVTFEPGRPDSLGAALTTLARDRTLLDELRVHARRAALDRYNAEAQSEILASVWRG
jgi:glycosyltransferase involved in cell wall biosynthesis